MKTYSHRITFVMVAALIASLAVGCTKDDPLFCCTTAESCAAAGESQMFPCADPARPYCNNDWRECTATPGGACNGPSDCEDSELPFCVEQMCVACEASGDCAATTPVCNSAHVCEACANDNDCAGRADAPFCLEATGACVACAEAADCMTATAPVCDETEHVCRGCSADAECASNVCEVDTGACVAEADVIYVATNGTDSGDCTQGSPCRTFEFAFQRVGASRNVVKAFPGTYTGQVAVDAITVTIHGDSATLKPGATDESVVEIQNGADVTLEGLTISGAGGSGTVIGVRTSSSTASVRLRRSIITSNPGGGISISGAEFSLINNVVTGNGSASSAFGGVLLANITTAGEHEFAFNTVSANTGAATTTTGVACSVVTVPIGLSSNIVYSNGVASGTPTQVSSGMCAWSYSDIGPQGVSGTGNINMDPAFIDPTNGNFRLQSTSPAIDAGDPAATTTVDIDGDTRPQNGRSDMGADEVVL